MFALRHKKTGLLMGVLSDSNHGGEFCTATQFYLEPSDWAENIWVVLDRETAEKAAVTNMPWYNAGYQTPSNEHAGNLEVVELTLKG